MSLQVTGTFKLWCVTSVCSFYKLKISCWCPSQFQLFNPFHITKYYWKLTCLTVVSLIAICTATHILINLILTGGTILTWIGATFICIYQLGKEQTIISNESTSYRYIQTLVCYKCVCSFYKLKISCWCPSQFQLFNPFHITKYYWKLTCLTVVSLIAICTATHILINLILTGGTILTWIGATFICIYQLGKEQTIISNESTSYRYIQTLVCYKCVCSFYKLKISCWCPSQFQLFNPFHITKYYWKLTCLTVVSLIAICTATHILINLILTGGTILTWIGATFICIYQLGKEQTIISNESTSYRYIQTLVCYKCVCSFYKLKISCWCPSQFQLFNPFHITKYYWKLTCLTVVSLIAICTATHILINLILTGGTILTWIGATFICIYQLGKEQTIISNESTSYRYIQTLVCYKCVCSFYKLKISCWCPSQFQLFNPFHITKYYWKLTCLTVVSLIAICTATHILINLILTGGTILTWIGATFICIYQLGKEQTIISNESTSYRYIQTLVCYKCVHFTSWK